MKQKKIEQKIFDKIMELHFNTILELRRELREANMDKWIDDIILDLRIDKSCDPIVWAKIEGINFIE